MVKVYIVTSGSYSDYSIEKVFLDEEKAEKYANCFDTTYYMDSVRVEVHETSDDEEINEITYVTANYRKYSQEWRSSEVTVNILKSNTIDDTVEDLTSNWFYKSTYGYELTIKRVISNENYDEDVIKNKYKKVLEDMMYQIEYLISTGWTEQMIQESLNNKEVE